MTYNITKVSALEILDSRSRPTLEVTVELRGGAKATAGVPSGASTGSKEAVELRDGGEAFGGAGVTKARENVEGEIRHLLTTRSFDSQAELDKELIDLDGTDNKSRLGSNAILGASMAFARAAAMSESKELWQWLDGVPGQEPRLPVPCFNVLNGGEHAANPLEFQEFMICPLGAKGMHHAVQAGSEIYSKLRSLLVAKGETVGLGDEGGFAPNIATPEEALELLTTAITEAGYSTGRDGVMIALDPAASEFHEDGAYLVGGEKLSYTDMINRYEQMVKDFPIWSIEDGVAEDDDEGWKAMTEAMGEKIQLVGDDNFCTNPKIISRAIDNGIANASLIKLNQIGTVTETLEAMRLCQKAGYGQMISHRSGETPDPFIADFAVATGAGQMKSGAPARGERIAKYNRLLEIARHGLPYGLA